MSAHVLRIGPQKRTKADEVREIRRAAIVLRRGMRPTEFRNVETALDRNNVMKLPIVVGDNRSVVPDALCGLIVTGADSVAHPVERARLAAIIREAVRREVPVLAISDAAPVALAACSLDRGEENHAGILIDGAVTVLADPRQIDRAIDTIAHSPAH